MVDQFTDARLLKITKTGSEEPTEEIIKLKSEWEIVPELERGKLSKRREMRHNMFKIIGCLRRESEMTPELEAIKSIIDPQLDNNRQINWATFTFQWDLYPDDHTRIITKEHWFDAGGRHDEVGILTPTAFTKQEID